MRAFLPSVATLKFRTFQKATALQRKLSFGGFLGSRLRSACLLPHGSQTPTSGGYSRLIVLTVYGLVPFIVSFTI